MKGRRTGRELIPLYSSQEKNLSLLVIIRNFSQIVAAMKLLTSILTSLTFFSYLKLNSIFQLFIVCAYLKFTYSPQMYI